MLDNSGLALMSDGYKAKVMFKEQCLLERAVSLREDIELLRQIHLKFLTTRIFIYIFMTALFRRTA